MIFEAIHADWPAYPDDKGWTLPLLRLGDFPFGTEFTCVSVVDQIALFVADVGIRERDPFSEKHMHVAIRLEDLLELDDRRLVKGVTVETSLSPDQINMKRNLGPGLWEEVRTGQTPLGRRVDGEFIPIAVPDDGESLSDLSEYETYPPRRSPERVAMYEGTVIALTPQRGMKSNGSESSRSKSRRAYTSDCSSSWTLTSTTRPYATLGQRLKCGCVSL